MKDKIFIIIVTFNGMKWLPECLESTKPYPVIVVDNNSQDNTVEYIETKYPEITLFKQDKNLGFGQANNIGISYALLQGADYVFLLNQDAYLEGTTIIDLIKIQEWNPKLGVLSPIHLDGKGEKLDRNFSYYLMMDKNQDFYSDYVLSNRLKRVYEVPFVNAAGWLISKKCIETVGGFDPIFFHYGEDDNYCQRLKYHGFKIGVVPNTFLKHDRENREKDFFSSRDVYYDKQERFIKVKYADINEDNVGEISNIILNRKKRILKSFLRLKFSGAKAYYKEISFLKRVSNEIEESRKINKSPGMKYL